MLFDTDVLISYFRGSTKAADIIERDVNPKISVVTYMELLQGVRDKKEMRAITSFLADMGIATLALTENIGHRASIYLEAHVLRDGMTMADALIAATAAEKSLILCTGNVKHFRVIEDLQIEAFRAS